MAVRVEIISIGTLSRNPFWGETGAVRASHATTTLIREGNAHLLVDPSLPPEVLGHRLHERMGLGPSQIDRIFLTNFRPIHRRGLPMFPDAEWLIPREERESVEAHLKSVIADAETRGDIETRREAEEELALLGRTVPAPDKLSASVHLFPSPGVTPGAAALLVPEAHTWVIAGDAIITREHYEEGRIFERCVNPEQARESFVEIAEVADVIVPGHGNLFIADRRFE